MASLEAGPIDSKTRRNQSFNFASNPTSNSGRGQSVMPLMIVSTTRLTNPKSKSGSGLLGTGARGSAVLNADSSNSDGRRAGLARPSKCDRGEVGE